ncbi:hypothetical protein NL676_004304 [Syzygium grande]|nr:hypothetical protein NL676_004304 [Syzygium grande]
MDAKALVDSLRERVSSPVEVVQPKKDKDGGGGSGGRKNKKGGGNGNKEEGDGGGGGGDKDGAKEMYGGAGEYFGRSRMEYNGIPPSYGYNSGFMYRNSSRAPQMFIDENPNALTRSMMSLEPSIHAICLEAGFLEVTLYDDENGE